MADIATEAGQALFLEWIGRYQYDPVLFVREALGVEPYPKQREILEAYGRGERKMSAKSGHGVGKSAVASWIAVHHILTRFPQKTVVTAPSSSQLYDALFAEIKHWIRRLPPPVQQLLEIKADAITLKAAPESSFISARTSRADQPEAMQGVHSDNVLLIGDEASGIAESVFEASIGSMSGENATTLLLGNPNHSSGFFYRTHTDLRGDWWTITISCVDAPGVSPAYIEDVRKRYGEQSNAFRVRVLGEFPLSDDDTVIPYEMLESAMLRDVRPTTAQPAVWGVDVARMGKDRSALAKRRGNALLEPVKTFRQMDTMQLVGAIKAEYDDCYAPDRPLEINVDAIGIGAGVADRLAELGLPARSINVSEHAALRERYRNLRAELWFTAREWFARRDASIPKDETLVNELALVKFKYTANGKLQIESKEDIKKRGFDSPDVADAFIMTFAGDALTVLYGHGPGRGWGRPIRRNLKGIV